MMEDAIKTALDADILIVIGTSLVVYPAASIVSYVPVECPIYVVDPNLPQVSSNSRVHYYETTATKGILAATTMTGTCVNTAVAEYTSARFMVCSLYHHSEHQREVIHESTPAE